MKRREILKTLTILPLAGTIGNSGSLVQSVQASSKPKRDLFKEFGLRTFINAAGYFTSLSGSLMQDTAMDVIEDTSLNFCRLEDVQDKVSAKIAGLLHAESAMVTAGAFSALMLGMAGVLSRNDPEKVSQIPFLEGTVMKTEVILQKAHNDGYAHALSNCGVKLITVETIEELENAISEKTAMMYFINYQASLGKIQHHDWLELAKKHQLPTMIDMAADLPPKENLWKFHDMGFDLVCVSGGKFMRGPQSTGILSGRKDLIAAAISVPGVKTELLPLPLINRVPTLNISWDITKIKLESLPTILRNGNPSIEVMGGPTGSINVTSHMLKEHEVNIVASRIREELSKALI